MKSILFRSSPAILAALLVAGCGGGGDAPEAPAVAMTALSGIAATGAPVNGAQVSVTCVGTASVTTITSAQGTWSVNLQSPNFPCRATVTGGSLPAGLEMYGYALSATNVNVTPLTTLIGAYATQAANGAALTQALLDAAVIKVNDVLVGAGFQAVPANPLTAQFSPTAGDTHDDLIEALMAALSLQGTTLNTVATQIASNGAPSEPIEGPSSVAFDATPATLPGNVVSYGVQAYALSGIGDRITLATGTPRVLRGVTVAMSSWACQSGGAYDGNCVSAANATFVHPITIRIYNDSGVLLATRTQDFTMPYRPSFDATCTGGKWKSADGVCRNGLAFKIDFDLHSLNVTLPDVVKYEVSYNTQTYGAQPTGQDGPYNSLNVGVYDVATATPSVGTDPDSGSLLWNGALTNTYDMGDTSRYGVMAQFQVGKN